VCHRGKRIYAHPAGIIGASKCGCIFRSYQVVQKKKSCKRLNEDHALQGSKNIDLIPQNASIL